ncbi:MAG: OsmC family peroxiredoxin [Chloroflexi bacterium]|nr:MAG: OsmC family peroxiredoxin [Chloroflexota bacterium]
MSNIKTARASWTGKNLEFDATMGSGYQFKMSSKPGAESGSPMEMLLAGVVGCTGIDVVSILQKMRQNVHGVEVEIKAKRAEDYPMVYTEAELVYVVRGENIDPQSVEKAIELSEEKYCSASIMFRRSGVEMSTSYRIEEQAAA